MASPKEARWLDSGVNDATLAGRFATRWLRTDGESHNDSLLAMLNLFGDERQTFGFPKYCDGPAAVNE